MTDRELLELAAKATGIEGEWSPTYESIHVNTAPLRNYVLWNPLTDDGDAFRLAVKLGVKDYFGVEIQKTCAQATAFDPWEHCHYEEHNADPYAATRRAIVRAAAEIGKGMA